MAGERSEQARIAGLSRDAKPSGVAASPAKLEIELNGWTGGQSVKLGFSPVDPQNPCHMMK